MSLLKYGLQEPLLNILSPAAASIIKGCLKHFLWVAVAATHQTRGPRDPASDNPDGHDDDFAPRSNTHLTLTGAPASNSVSRGLVKLSIGIIRQGRKWKRGGGAIFKPFNMADQDGAGAKNGSGHCCEVDPMAEFASVLARARLALLPAYACKVRRQGLSEGSDKPLDAIDYACCASSTTVEGPPMCGSFNVLFPILFADGVCWIIKIPAAGTSELWDQSAAQALESEALTMRMLKQSTSIPIPAVHAFNSGVDNELGCPFILMDHIEGRLLYQAWFDDVASEDREALESFRIQSLKSLAASLAELRTFNFKRSGSLVYNSDGHVQSIGPARAYDAPARWETFNRKGPDLHTPFFDMDTCNNGQDFLLSMLNRHRQKQDPFGQGLDKMLRLFIGWVPELHAELPFGLSHPDCDLQNILVKEDGTVCGLIDWDGVAAVPRSVGCQSFPKFLIRDWDRFFYNFDPETGSLKDDDARDDNSPEELAHYRGIYARAIENCLSRDRHGRKESRPTQDSTTPFLNHHGSSTTRQSLIVGSLYTAVREPLSTTKIIFDIFDKIFEITAHRPMVQTPVLVHDDPFEGIDSTSSDGLHHCTEGLGNSCKPSGSDDDLGLSDLEEFAWITQFNTGPENCTSEKNGGYENNPSRQYSGSAILGDIAPGLEGSHQHGQNQEQLAAFQKNASTTTSKRKCSWVKEQLTKIGSLVSKTSSRLGNGRRSQEGPFDRAQASPRTKSAAHGSEIKCFPYLCLTSNSTSSTGSTSSTATSGAESAETEVTDPSDAGDQGLITLQHSAVKPTDPEPLYSTAQSTVAGANSAKSNAGKLAQGSSIHSASDETDTTPTKSADVISHPPLDIPLRCIENQRKQPKKLKKGACRLARRFLAKLPLCKSKDVSGSYRNDTNATVEPSACPVTPETHEERTVALQKAARQKFPDESKSSPTSTEFNSEAVSSPLAPSKSAGQNGSAVEEDYYVEKDFTDVQVCVALSKGELDEARMRRLKDGFHLLLNSL